MVNDTYYIQVPLLKNEKDRLRVHLYIIIKVTLIRTFATLTILTLKYLEILRI